MDGYWAWLRSPVFPVMHRLVNSELHSFPDLAAFYATEVIERAQRLVCGMIQRCIEAGVFRRMDPLVAARMLSALFITHGNWYHQRSHFVSIASLPDEQLFEPAAQRPYAATSAVTSAGSPSMGSSRAHTRVARRRSRSVNGAR